MLGELFKTTDADLVLKICQIINYVFCVAMVIIYANQFIYILLSIFIKPKRYKEATKEHTYGYIICGKNEQSVIGNLIESIKKQDYPTDKMHIFVCADNCTDDTEKVSKKAGAKIIKCTVPTKSKGEVLKFTFDKFYTLNAEHIVSI